MKTPGQVREGDVMRRLAGRSCLVVLVAVAGAGALVPGAAQAARPGHPAPPAAATKWTKISSNTGLGIASAGLFRTSDGRLHVAWARKDGGTYSLHYSTLGGKAALLATGTIVQKWSAISAYPRLVAGPSGGIRLVFTGGNGVGGSPYNLGAMYSATSTSAGTKWTLTPGSLSQSTNVSLTDTSATTQSDGTPVASWPGGSGVAYHVGLDPNTPATKPDQTVPVTEGAGFVVGTTLARGSDGSVWAGWFTESGASDQGYWVAKLLPSQATKVKAPGSGGTGLSNNQPFQSVAFAARAGGGEYLAYCVPSKTIECAHIALWRANAGAAAAVPGSATQHAIHVAIAAAPGGHLWVLWYDTSQNKIHVVRTNAAATKFAPVQTVAPPPSTGELDGLQAEGSQGPLDVVALVLQNASGSTPSYWDTQLLPKLTLSGSPSAVSHKKATVVTFKVTDVGDSVPGATVSFLGKTAKTNGKGIAQITVPKGTATGKHTATVTKADYTSATFTVTVS
jgi:hypothetical protein